MAVHVTALLVGLSPVFGRDASAGGIVLKTVAICYRQGIIYMQTRSS